MAKTSSSRSMPAPVHYTFKYVVNPVMKFLLRSPLHSLVSDGLLLLTFTGRKSGRQYSTPLAYMRENGTLYVTTQSPWWKNLQDGAPVSMRLQGQKREGHARPITDTAKVADVIYRDIKEHGAGYARRRYRLTLDADNPSRQQVKEQVQNTVLVEIKLDK